MDAEDLKKRTKQFGLRVIHVIEALPSSRAASVIGRNLLRSGTSVGANYGAACRARTSPDYISKLGMAIEQADESLYWMEMLVEAKLIPGDKLTALMKEANEIVAILTASAKKPRPRAKPRPRR
jgi:four helix bundle protein